MIRFLSTLGIAAFLWFFPIAARAARVQVVAPLSAGIDESFTATVTVDTQGEAINALEGAISYPRGALSLEGVRDGGSIVSFWIEQPQRPESCDKTCTIRWSGVIPGGYSGNDGPLFTLVFKAATRGSARIRPEQVKILLHDGRGSVAAIGPLFDAAVSIAPRAALAPAPPPFADAVPPLPFEVSIVRNDAAFDGQWFIVFSADDKESGIDRYEVSERKSPFTPARSPHLLGDQSLRGSVVVRAIDRAGNIREAFAKSPTRADELPVFGNWLVIAIPGLLLIILFGRVLWRRLRA